MDAGLRKIIFKLSTFLLLLSGSLLLVVQPQSAEFVVVVLSVAANLLLCSMILFLAWLGKRKQRKNGFD